MGRKSKIAIPKASRSKQPQIVASSPASAPAQGQPAQSVSQPDRAITDMQALLREARQRADAGKPLQHHHVMVIKLAWSIAMEQYLWPSIAVAAADLGISPSTLRGYGEQGCPGVEPHNPIPKHLVLTWLLARAHHQGGTPPTTKATIEDVELRIKLAKATAAEGTLVAAAEDRATQALIATVSELRDRLLRDLPTTLANDIRAAPDGTSAQDICIAALRTALADRPLTLPTQDT